MKIKALALLTTVALTSHTYGAMDNPVTGGMTLVQSRKKRPHTQII
jgi:hypothetical protein